MFVSRKDLPDKENWKKLIEKATREIKIGHLQKVVLARKTTLQFEAPIDPKLLFSRLKRRAAPTTTKFCLELGEEHTFLGASPEVLFSREKRVLHTMALAGTSKTTQFTQKDKEEVDWALHGIKESLLPLCDTLDVEPLQGLRSTKVNHLHYPIKALLKQKVSDTHLIDALHPTAAIGGWPRKEALCFIKAHEPFDRGPYAEPLGFSTLDRGFFVVGIRSAIVEGSFLHLFAGTGIVQDSDPLQEWMELEAKISPFMEIL